MTDSSTWSPSFNSSIEVSCDGEGLSSNAGALLLRETMEKLGIVAGLVERLQDPRRPDLVVHSFEEVLRTLVVLVALGWRDLDDADALRDDPLLRLAVSERTGARPLKDEGDDTPNGLPSQPTLSRLLRIFAEDDNRSVLAAAPRECALRRHRLTGAQRLPLAPVDVDSFPVRVDGSQYGSAYNGYYKDRVYHPLLASYAPTGEHLGAMLREGNVSSAKGVVDFLTPILDAIEGENGLCDAAIVRADAAFPCESFFGFVEGRAGTQYVARIKSNERLNELARPYLQRGPGRRPATTREWTYDLTYAAEKWSKARRAILVVQDVPGELFLNHFWLITSFAAPPLPDEKLAPGAKVMAKEDVLELYRARGTMEARIGDFMSTLAPSLASTLRPKSHYAGHRLEKPQEVFANPMHVNEVILLINLLAANVMTALRLLTDKNAGVGSHRRTVDRVLRYAARVTVHARKVIIRVEKSSARVWQFLLAQLAALRPLTT